MVEVQWDFPQSIYAVLDELTLTIQDTNGVSEGLIYILAVWSYY